MRSSRVPRRHGDKHFSPDEFDDELEDLEQLLPDEAQQYVPLLEDVSEQVLPGDAIDIDTLVGVPLPRSSFVSRVHHHFADDDLGYKPLRRSTDSFKLRVRSARYPWFGAFSGRVHVVEDFGHHPGAHPSVRFYRLTGLLRFRVSVLYAATVALAFFLFLLWTSPGFAATVVFFFLGVGSCIAAGYAMGRGQRDEALDRVEESILRLRSTVMNRR